MILLKGGYLIDTKHLEIKKRDILIEGRKIKRISQKLSLKGTKVIDVSGKFIAPALFDMHVHSRVPGKEYAEDFYSLSKACLRGGVGGIVVMPNTVEVTDDIHILKRLKKISNLQSPLNIYFTSAITECEEGKNLVDFKKNSKYVVGFTDDGRWLFSSKLMDEAIKMSLMVKRIILSHPQLPISNGHINEGKVSKYLKISGIPSYTEYIAVFRDCLLAILNNSPLHLQHISCGFSVDLIKEAKKINSKITAETCPHYFWFCEEDVVDANFKMNPPLRGKKDIKRIIDGVKEGTIDVIATDHAPHTPCEKSLSLEKAPFGVIGVETLFSASVDKLHVQEKIPIEKIIAMMSLNPAKILNIKDKGFLSEGLDADLIVFSFNEWEYRYSYSKSRNSPFLGKKFKSRVEMTMLKGKMLYDNERFFI